MMKNVIILLFSLTLIISVSSCKEKDPEKKEAIEYSIETLKNRPFLKGGYNIFNIVTDSNYYEKVFRNGEELKKEHLGYSYVGQDSILKLEIKLYHINTDSLIKTDSLSIAQESIPDPILYLMPCKDSCNNLDSIKNATYITPEVRYKGWHIIAGLKNYTITLIRNETVIKQLEVTVTNEQNIGGGYSIEKSVKELLTNTKTGDRIEINNIKVSLPDGTNRILKNKQWLTSSISHRAADSKVKQ